VRIVSADPDIDPHVEENMLSDDRDLIRMRDMAHRFFALARQPAIQAIAERITVGPADKGPDDLDDATLDAWLLGTTQDAQHACGTCRMGASGDARTVVDSRCRVLGV